MAARSKFQRFDVERWHRSRIQGAPYNPRTLSDAARAKLRANLDVDAGGVGLLDPLTVNRRTGNLVSGHQRLAILDALEGREDYSIDVSVVELSDKQEREQNIFFNQRGAQGDWDAKLLGQMLPGLSIAATGFDDVTLRPLFDTKAIDELLGVKRDRPTLAYVEALAVPEDEEDAPAEYDNSGADERPDVTDEDDAPAGNAAWGTKEHDNRRANYPLPIVLGQSDKRSWDDYKKRVGTSGDTAAFLLLLNAAKDT